MKRHLLPRIDWGGWSGDAVTDVDGLSDAVEGGSIYVQWLGLFFELAVGRVHSGKRGHG
jgi:hypothetical protein